MADISTPKGPLVGIKVIEMGTFLIAGPCGARLLAEFGADVIKIEVPKKGDPIRNWRVVHNDNGTSLWWVCAVMQQKMYHARLWCAGGGGSLKDAIARGLCIDRKFSPRQAR